MFDDLEDYDARDAYTYLRSIYQNPLEPTSVRMKAAIEALPFERPKLAVVASAQMNGQDFATLLDKAVLRSQSVRSPPRLIEAPPMKTASGRTPEAVSGERMTKGFQPLRRRPL